LESGLRLGNDAGAHVDDELESGLPLTYGIEQQYGMTKANQRPRNLK
jgi:hypothetical protein